MRNRRGRTSSRTSRSGRWACSLTSRRGSRAGREGEQRWLQAFVSPVRDEAGGVREVTLILKDVTDRKALEDRLSHQVYYDGLTGLPNCAHFLDRLEQALRRLKRAGGARQRVAVLFTDLDNFKYVNDTLGHEAGDELLVEVAGRIASCLRPEDTVARFGGDEFVVLLEGRRTPVPSPSGPPASSPRRST